MRTTTTLTHAAETTLLRLLRNDLPVGHATPRVTWRKAELG